jgi:hypothetical protein
MKQNLILYPVNLRLFDGAAPAAAPSAPAPGTAPSGEQTTSSAAGKKKGDLSNVVYGKQDIPDSAIPDVDDTPQAAAESTVATSDTLEAKKAEFENLISGDYKDFFSERVQGIINNRFKEFKTLEGQVNAMKPILDILGSKYGITDGNIEKLSKAIQEDNTYFEEEALEKGLSVEQLKQIKQMERENAELKKAQADIEARRNAELTYQRWTQEAEGMKQIYPNFDLKTECKSPDFVNMLKAGVGVKAAFNALHHDEILSGAMQVTAQKVKSATVNNITSRSQRPTENGVSSQAGVVIKPNVEDLSTEDIFDIAERSKRGETIRF